MPAVEVSSSPVEPRPGRTRRKAQDRCGLRGRQALPGHQEKDLSLYRRHGSEHESKLWTRGGSVEAIHDRVPVLCGFRLTQAPSSRVPRLATEMRSKDVSGNSEEPQSLTPACGVEGLPTLVRRDPHVDEKVVRTVATPGQERMHDLPVLPQRLPEDVATRELVRVHTVTLRDRSPHTTSCLQRSTAFALPDVRRISLLLGSLWRMRSREARVNAAADSGRACCLGSAAASRHEPVILAAGQTGPARAGVPQGVTHVGLLLGPNRHHEMAQARRAVSAMRHSHGP